MPIAEPPAFHVPDDAWSTFAQIAGMDERARRRLLRFHRDRSVSDLAEQDQREALDRALNHLSLREVAFEIGVVAPGTRFAEDAERSLLKTLLSSNAFVRYADNYLTLNLHFVAERLGLAFPSTTDDLNELPVPWPCPPPIPLPSESRDAAMRDFLGTNPIEAPSTHLSARKFLDDFSLFGAEEAAPEQAGVDQAAVAVERGPYSGDKPATRDQQLFELWLRGLADPPIGEWRLDQLAYGLESFARDKASFYRTLEGEYAPGPGDAPSSRVTFIARNPMSARFGLFDLYWIARLLRVEVTPAGTVTVVTSSWLELLAQRAERNALFEPYGMPAFKAQADELRSCDDVLRGILDYTCDLVQNALDIVYADLNEAAEPAAARRPAESLGWRATFDEELEQIAHQRRERHGGSPGTQAGGSKPQRDGGGRWTEGTRRSDEE